jgi:hypothetical protein
MTTPRAAMRIEANGGLRFLRTEIIESQSARFQFAARKTPN